MLKILSASLNILCENDDCIKDAIDGSLNKIVSLTINGVGITIDQKMKMHQLYTSKENKQYMIALRDESYIIDDSCHDNDYEL